MGDGVLSIFLITNKKMIKVFNDFITKDFADEVINYVRTYCKNNVWGVSNLNYNPKLIESSAPILSMQLHDKLNKKLKFFYTEKFKEFKDKEFLIEFKIYTPGSYITWHDDDLYLAGSTIYLNRDYHENDGGVLLYKDNKNDIKGVEPKYRSMILNYKKKNSHCVTMVTPKPRFLRETLQIFIKG